jgi:leukotriene-A4 hydrolase
LERLQAYPTLPSSHISHLGELYQLSTSSDAEIRLRFYELALTDPLSDTAKTFARTASDWVVGNDGTGIIKGRMKFCRPIFRAIFAVDKCLAVEAFTNFRDQFHPIARKLIEKVCPYGIKRPCFGNKSSLKDLVIA